MVNKNRSAAHIALYNAPENINTNVLAKENALKHSTANLLLKLVGMESFTFKDGVDSLGKYSKAALSPSLLTLVVN